jgi:hypothetical protein
MPVRPSNQHQALPVSFFPHSFDPLVSQCTVSDPLFLRGGKNLLGQLKPRSSRKAKRAASAPKKEEELGELSSLAGSSEL